MPLNTSKILKSAVESSLYQYPYQNLSLIDIVDETWKPFPGYEERYMISNKGRIKILSRQIEQFVGKHLISHQIKEKISKQSIFKSFSKYRNEYTYALAFVIGINKKSKNYRVSRVVYETFIGPIPKGMIVLHKGDSLDNSVENLYLASKTELARIKQDKNQNIINAKGGLFAEKVVSQYDLEGNYIATFNSIKQACNATGINASGITDVINGKRNRSISGNCFWRLGNDTNKLDVTSIYKNIEERRSAGAQVHGKQIVQYSLEGKYIAVYDSIKAATEKTGLSRIAISEVLYGRRYLSREFIWKYADSFKDGKVPSQIILEEYKLPEPAQTANKRKGKKYPRYDYPYQDLFLFDIDGEVWKEVPEQEEYCMVSNLGRIKTIPRFIDRPNNGRMLIKERIVKQAIRTFKENKRVGIWNRCLYFSIGIEGRIFQMAVARAVYSAFIGPLPDFKEDKMFILHKDLDNLNNRVENLYMATREQMGKRNVDVGMMSPPDVSQFTDELWQKIKERSMKQVSQYTRDGKYIATFPSIIEASRITGVHKGGIVQVAKDNQCYACGFIWRYGSDTKDLDEETLQKHKPKLLRTKSINQYDLNGKFLASFDSIAEAARKFGYNRRNLNEHILKQTPDFDGYIWRYSISPII